MTVSRGCVLQASSSLSVTPSLQAAHNLCLLAASLLEQGSEQHRRCVEMADLSEKLLLQLRGVER